MPARIGKCKPVPQFETDIPPARAFWQLRLWLAEHPEVDAFCPGEADEVVLASEASPTRLDVAVPQVSVKALRWQPRRKPARPIKHLAPTVGSSARSVSRGSTGSHLLSHASHASLLGTG
jgi:hypothetical protein